MLTPAPVFLRVIEYVLPGAFVIGFTVSHLPATFADSLLPVYPKV
jgi:hypothetical protein